LSILFPSAAFFEFCQQGLAADPSCSKHVEPSDAYCGFAIEDELFVFEFDGHSCSAVVRGGNELDLDFVLAGPEKSWRRAVEAAGDEGGDASLEQLIKGGDLEIRSSADDGPALANAALPLLQVFLERAKGTDLDFA
jgi:hypothetical protein